MESFESSLRCGLSNCGSSKRILLREFDGPQGRPDLVDAHIHALPDFPDLEALAATLSSPSKARILASLRYGANRSRRYLERVTGLSNSSLARHIRHLEAHGLVLGHRNSTVALGYPLPWSMVEIVTYEGKISDWRRALHQAIGYRAFSRSVRVVMPLSGAQRAKQFEKAFRNNGIGLIAVENDGSMHVAIRSRKRRPASRRLYLMAVGAVLDRFISERHHTAA